MDSTSSAAFPSRTPAQVAGTSTVVTSHHDLVVIGATPSGIACAVRAARAGHAVLLTQHSRHIGGLLTNGLIQWDALSDHRRCPIFREILERVATYYRETYGADSRQAHLADYRMDRHHVGLVEPRVIEQVFEAMVAAEPRITLWREVYPAAAATDRRRVVHVDLLSRHGAAGGMHGVGARRRAVGRVFVDATYEGDLAALAGVPCRVGREARTEYDEPHAGQIRTRLAGGGLWPQAAVEGRVRMIPYAMHMGGIDPRSDGAGDRAIQAYNCRPCLTSDPANRLIIDTPPEGYDRADYLGYLRRYLSHGGNSLINGKGTYNAPILPGENWDYPEGDWTVRDRITRRHQDFATGLIYFLQNDVSIDAKRQADYRQWGLPLDEFVDHGHLPYEMYVRETRRIVGRHVISERDLSPRPGRQRTRPFADSIAFTDWYMDSHSCSRDSTYDSTWHPEYPFDGKLILADEMRPGMIPYASLLPPNLDNLLVPVCVASTHVAWGAIRLEPVWIHLGEVAGVAACMALAPGGNADVASLSVAQLQRRLLDDGADIAFFNQHPDVAPLAPRRSDYATRQLAACHGEWDSYDLDA